jgi:hypothetical protein
MQATAGKAARQSKTGDLANLEAELTRKYSDAVTMSRIRFVSVT